MKIIINYFYCFIFCNIFVETLRYNIANDTIDDFEHYKQYFAYTGVYHYPHMVSLMWNGALISRDLVLTTRFYDLETFFQKINPNVPYQDKAYPVVLTGTTNAIRDQNAESKMTPCKIDKRLNNRADVTSRSAQLVMLRLEELVEMKIGERWSVPLSTKKRNPGEHCIALGDGAHHKHSVRAIKVEITEETTCLSDDRFCIEIIDKNVPLKVSHCDIFYGGEPIICTGHLVGFINAYTNDSECNPNSALPCTSVYNHLDWINNYMSDYLGVIKSKSSLLEPSTITLFTIVQIML